MSKGNPFGREGGRWMPTAKLRALFAAGLTYDEIALINERSEGWRPSRASVSEKHKTMGLPPRRSAHRDLLPWKIRPEHNSSIYRYMLQAESRARKGGELSDTDRKLVARLHEQLFGRGSLMVIEYIPASSDGFYLTVRRDSDEDVIRSPAEDEEDEADSPEPAEVL